jgi:protein-S-isoprenylcysteine O-methyltransferase Ste14
MPNQQTIIASERRSQQILWLSILLSLALALTFKQLAWLPIPIAYLPRQLLAIILFICGLGLRYWSINHLGHFFTTHVTIQQQHCLIQTGPYKLIRHPAYTGLLVALAAAGLAMGDFLTSLLITLPTFLAFKSRIDLEESMLKQKFNNDYVDYSSRSWRLIPGIY